MLRRNITHFSWMFLLLFLVLLPVFTSCDANPGGLIQTTTATTGNLDRKGPGSAGLTATALATPIPTVCLTYSATAASIMNWKLYQDMHYPFHFSIPSGWQAGSIAFSGGGNTYYDILLLPSGSTAPFNVQSETSTPENFIVSVLLSGTADTFTNDPNFIPEATKITVSGVKATIYNQAPNCQEVDRLTDWLKFGEYTYHFSMKSYPAHASNDTALFLGMIQSFVYTG